MKSITQIWATYNDAADQARAYFSAIRNTQLTRDDITKGLEKYYESDLTGLLFEVKPDFLEIIRVLNDYDFDKSKFEGTISIELDPDSFPAVYGFLNEQQVKNANTIWDIHKHDADPFPHPVHAHDYERRVKLDLATGDLYKKRKLVGSIPQKELLNIRGKVKGLTLPPLP